MASSEIGLANAMHRRGEGRAARSPIAAKLNVPLLMEAQEIMKIDPWLVDQSRRRAVVSRPGDACRTIRPAGRLPRCCRATARSDSSPATRRSRAASITVRFGGRAVLIDTGMLASVYKGRASALEIDGDKLTAYLRRRQSQLQ